MKIPIEELQYKAANYDLDYTTLVESYGYEIINRISLGSYSGDIIMIVGNNNGKYGLLTTCFGSCSGCDELQSCGENIAKLDKLRTSLCEGVIFRSADELIEYMENKDWELEHYTIESKTEQFKEFLEQSKEELIFRQLARI